MGATRSPSCPWRGFCWRGGTREGCCADGRGHIGHGGEHYFIDRFSSSWFSSSWLRRWAFLFGAFATLTWLALHSFTPKLFWSSSVVLGDDGGNHCSLRFFLASAQSHLGAGTAGELPCRGRQRPKEPIPHHARQRRGAGAPLAYWFTFSSMNVPLSSLTLFLSELNTEPCAVVCGGSSFRLEMPTTPCVLPVIGGRAPAC